MFFQFRKKTETPFFRLLDIYWIQIELAADGLATQTILIQIQGGRYRAS